MPGPHETSLGSREGRKRPDPDCSSPSSSPP